MSRYNLPSEENGETVAIGWDNPLETFFFQVLDSHDEPIIEVGQRPGEVPMLVQLIQVAEGHGYCIPDNILRRLRADRANASEPTELQKKMRSIFSV